MNRFSSALKKFKRSRTSVFLMFAAVPIVGYLLFYFYPILRTLMLSFTDKTMTRPDVNVVWLDNYIRIFRNETLLGMALVNSIIYAFGSGVITLVIAFFMALLLNSKVKGVGVFRIILFLPFVIPTFASAAIFKGLFDPNSGLINVFLYDNFGIQGPGWFKSEDTALLTMILMSIWGFGIQMLIFLSALQNVPASLYEAAEIDGASKTRKFLSITMPMISPMLFLNVVLVTINGLKSFNTGYLIGGVEGNPNNSTLLFPVLIYRIAFNTEYGGRRLGYASALAYIFFLVIMVFTAVQFIMSKFYVNKDVE